MQFSVEIHAQREKVWETLLQDETFRIWANLIDPGTYMEGELKEGGTVQFISAENGYGVTSLVEKLVPTEYLLLKHQADTQEHGTAEREGEWTGGSESYTLHEQDGTTTLTLTCDIPNEMQEYFKRAYPNALNKIKDLAEA